MKTGLIIIISLAFFSCQPTVDEKSEKTSDSIFISAKPLFNNLTQDTSLEYARQYSESRLTNIFGENVVKVTIKDSLIVFSVSKSFNDVEKLKALLTNSGRLSFYSFCAADEDLKIKIESALRKNDVIAEKYFEAENEVGKFDVTDTSRINVILRKEFDSNNQTILFSWQNPAGGVQEKISLFIMKGANDKEFISENLIDSAIISGFAAPQVRVYINKSGRDLFNQMITENSCATIAVLLDGNFMFSFEYPKTLKTTYQYFELGPMSIHDAAKISAVLTSGLLPLYFEIKQIE